MELKWYLKISTNILTLAGFLIKTVSGCVSGGKKTIMRNTTAVINSPNKIKISIKINSYPC